MNQTGRGGAAYFFRPKGSEWIEQVKFTASDGGDNDGFGVSASFTNDMALIGANGDDIGTYFDQGSAYVFNDLIPVGIDPGVLVENLPLKYALEQNYPHPFNPVTALRCRLSVYSDIELTVYNLLGQGIKTLVRDRRPAGVHRIQWYGKNENGELVSAGVYFCRLDTDCFLQMRKMVLLR